MKRKRSVSLVVGLPVLTLVVLLLGGSSAARFATAEPAAAPPPAELDSTMWTAIQNVDLRVGAKPDEGGALRVRRLHGRVFETTPGRLPFLDEPESFGIEVTSGSVALDGEGLTTLLTERVFNYRGSPIRSLRVTVENGQLVQRGIIRKGVDMRFTMWSNLSLTDDNRIRSHPTKLTLLGVNGLSLLHALGLKMEKVLDVSGTKGIVQMQGDDMLLDPLKMIPPPRVVGRLESVKVEGDEIVQTFATTPDDSVCRASVRVDTSVKNYIYYKGAALRFGRLTMEPTDLLIADTDESDRFDLDLARYNEQLTAGYTRIIQNNALRTWMPDRADLKDGRVPPPLVPRDVRGGAQMRPPR
ncbi:MAG: hypothetical protein ACRENU_03580 [Gemmatimonadaceae bacterium]